MLDILLAHGYSYRLSLDQHPDYRRRRAEFDAIEGFEALGEDDRAWLDHGYVDPPHLYCDAGTALWRRLTANGTIESVPLTRVPLARTVRSVTAAAEQRNDIELIALWHALGYDTFTVLDPRDDPATTAIRETAIRTGAHRHPLSPGLRPPVNEDDEPARWWHGEKG